MYPRSTKNKISLNFISLSLRVYQQIALLATSTSGLSCAQNISRSRVTYKEQCRRASTHALRLGLGRRSVPNAMARCTTLWSAKVVGWFFQIMGVGTKKYAPSSSSFCFTDFWLVHDAHLQPFYLVLRPHSSRGHPGRCQASTWEGHLYEWQLGLTSMFGARVSQYQHGEASQSECWL